MWITLIGSPSLFHT